MSNGEVSVNQVISLPKGGGALSNIGETFSPDLHTGTGNFSIPIAIPSGRNGFQPQLSLVYSTASGNGPFGLGWSMSIPGISRKTSKGIPRYRDERDPLRERDIFILSGAEDLVPIFETETATRYRPRTEGLFARIEHHYELGTNHWQVNSKDGLISLYGTHGSVNADPAVIADPADISKIYSWQLTQSVDLFGNRIVYEYERDSGLTLEHHWDQIYLKRIQFVDFVTESNPSEKFLISVSFVYDERPDPFSEYRSGFEIRTRKRCTRIEVRTFADVEHLTRTYHLTYLDQRGLPQEQLPLNAVSLLSQITVVGHDGEQHETFPPLEFDYTTFDPEQRHYQPLTAVTDFMPESSLSNREYELLDLFGNGLPDIIHMNNVVRYWRNLGNGQFDVPRTMASAPPQIRLSDSGVQLADANGNGHADLLVLDGIRNGYYPLSFKGSWDEDGFVPYAHLPPIALDAPDIRLMDLDGDGITDALRTGINFELYYNDPQHGWAEVEIRTRGDFDSFPDVNFSDPRVKLGNLTGDGLQSIVFVHNGCVEYWPYKGYGRWGRRITMQNSPRFEDATLFPGIGFDPQRLLLGDVDGDGLADLVYVTSGHISVWINQSGNAWSDPIIIHGTPPISNIDSVHLTDMLGGGTDGILWTYDFGIFTDSTYKFLDLTGGVKPYLLNQMDNKRGALTKVAYAPSTQFYLEDEQCPETRWKTHLPFPVQVVAHVEVIDLISQGKLTTEYHYHHGYWDGLEHEFRGFGMVEQMDTQSFDIYHVLDHNGQGIGFNSVDERHFSPPVSVKTWFHQGPVDDETADWEELDYSAEYWVGDPSVLNHTQSVNDFLKSIGDPLAKRSALRTLRGSILRTELYALDGSDRQDIPFTVTEYSYGLREELSSNDPERIRIFFPHQLAQRTSQWERGTEPMTQFSFMNDYDAYGMPASQTTFAVPRGRDYRSITTNSEPYLGTHTITTYVRRDDPERYFVDRVASVSTYEIINDGKLPLKDVHQAVQTGRATLRLFAQSFNYYDGEAFVGLPLGKLGDFGVLVRTTNLVLTETILNDIYRPRPNISVPNRPPYLVPSAVPIWTADYPLDFRNKVMPLAGYEFRTGNDQQAAGYIIQAVRLAYDFQIPAAASHRGMPLIMRDSLGTDTTIEYDQFQLMPLKVIDAVGLTTEAKYDYRAMQVTEYSDPNGNSTRYNFSPFGLLKEVFVLGKNGEGDQDHPSASFVYDFSAFVERGLPLSVRSIRREHHDAENVLEPLERDRLIETVEYTDGFGRLIQTRTQAEDIIFGDTAQARPLFGDTVLSSDQNDASVVRVPVTGQQRDAKDVSNVVVNGWQIYDNKGKVVEKYEPFFSKGFDYLSPEQEQRQFGRDIFGQKVTLFYDPRGQVIRTVNPDGSEQRVIYGIPLDISSPEPFTPTPWEIFTYDANDNAGRTHALEAQGYLHHWNTPTNTVIDALGRTVLVVERNRAVPDQSGVLPPIVEFQTRSVYDIRGNLLQLFDALNRPAFTHIYDLANRPLCTISIDAGFRWVVLDAIGSEIERRDTKGALVLQAYDVLHRPTQLWGRDDAASRTTLREVTAYGDGGDPQQNPTAREANRAMNRLGHLHQHYDEAGCTTIEGYDFKGNILEKTRQVITDAELLSVFATPTGLTAPTAYRTDWQTAQNLEPRADAILDPKLYRTSMTYDALNRVTVMRYPQDQEGQRKELHPHYNRAGALERVELISRTGVTVYVNHIAYSAKGQRLFIALGNGILTRYAYTPQTFRLHRLRSETYTQLGSNTFQPVGAALQDYVYEYDLVGNLLRITDRVSGCGVRNNPQAALTNDLALRALVTAGNALVRQFDYDAIYRLSSASGRECKNIIRLDPWSDDPQRCGFNATNHGVPNQANAPNMTVGYREFYTYDAVGNLTVLRHVAGAGSFTRRFKLVPNNNRLANLIIGDTRFDYRYDPNGNITNESTSRQQEWDYNDQIKSFRVQVGTTEPSLHAQYLYDSAGMRVKKLVRKQGGGFETTIYIDGVFEHHRWQTGENNHLHIMDGQQRIAMLRVGLPHPDDRGPVVKYVLGDHLGSSSITLSQDGSFINREEYTPYGESSFGGFGKKRYRFTGKERDEESGLYYHGARYYAPWLVRWTSCDPLEKASTSNSYTYTRSNPLRFTDPGGMDEDEPQLTGIIGLTLTQGSLEKGISGFFSMTLQDPINQFGLEGGLRGELTLFKEHMGVSQWGAVSSLSWYLGGSYKFGEGSNTSSTQLVGINHSAISFAGSGLTTSDQRIAMGIGKTMLRDVKLSSKNGSLVDQGLGGHTLKQDIGQLYLRTDRDDQSARMIAGNEAFPLGGDTDWFETMEVMLMASARTSSGKTLEFGFGLRALTDPIQLKPNASGKLERQRTPPEPGAPYGHYITVPIGTNHFPIFLSASLLDTESGNLMTGSLGFSDPNLQYMQDVIHTLMNKLLGTTASLFRHEAQPGLFWEINLSKTAQSSK